jgi:hypothetical protein
MRGMVGECEARQDEESSDEGYGMLIKVAVFKSVNSSVVNMRCPACRQMGSFEWTEESKDVQVWHKPPTYVGHRRCPNPECHAHVFVVLDATQKHLVVSYPPERIDFDPSNIPENIVSALEEAITCHANQCFVAAAIMVRKTLEELCSTENAQGQNLLLRIRALADQVVLPQELFEGLDDLRLLGNDAAHIESRAYHNIGQEEVEVALEFTKEVLKAIYQYKDLLGRLRALQSRD